MKRLLLIVLIIPLCLSGKAQDLESVLQKNSDALKLEMRKYIPHLKIEGYFVMRDSDSKLPFKVLQERPDHLRIETTIFGFKAIQTYNGDKAWLLTPTKGTEALETDPRDMEFIAAATALDGPFSLNKDNKYKLIYSGPDTFDEKECEVVIQNASEERLKFFINKKTDYIDAIRYEYKKNGGWYSMVYKINSYQSYEGSLFPQEVTAIINGVEMLTLHINKIGPIVNPDPAKFEKPSY